jgi:hypothetical protein
VAKENRVSIVAQVGLENECLNDAPSHISLSHSWDYMCANHVWFDLSAFCGGFLHLCQILVNNVLFCCCIVVWFL